MKKIGLLEEIPNFQAKSFPYDEIQGLVIYRKNDQCYAYINRCPHTGVPLEWNEDQFMSLDGHSIQCSTHGALFEPETGFCIYGPCKGASLKTLQVTVESGCIYLV